MKIKELKQKNDAELTLDLAALQEKLREMRFKIFSQELKNSKQINETRKTIARIYTLLKERSSQTK